MNVLLCVGGDVYRNHWLVKATTQMRMSPGGQDRTISNCFPLMAIPVDLWILMLGCYELVGDPVAGLVYLIVSAWM